MSRRSVKWERKEVGGKKRGNERGGRERGGRERMRELEGGGERGKGRGEWGEDRGGKKRGSTCNCIHDHSLNTSDVVVGC